MIKRTVSKALAFASALMLGFVLVANAANAPIYTDENGSPKGAQGVIVVNPDGTFGAGATGGLSETTFNSKTGSLTETAPASDTASSGLNGRLQRLAQNITSLIALFPSSIGQKAKAASLAVALASDTSLGRANSPTYTVQGVGYTAYATPTDMICIYGSASKTIYVTGFTLGIHSTAGALQTIYYVKRSTVNTGGTPTTPTPVSLDSANSAATATVTLYGSAPTTGTLVGNVRIVENVSVVLASAPSGIALTAVGATNFQTPVTLRGTGEGVCANYNGAALTSGFTSTYNIDWIEF